MELAGTARRFTHA